ncbi:MAG: serine/threonine-protein kinase [Pirellulaceae bacterium]
MSNTTSDGDCPAARLLDDELTDTFSLFNEVEEKWETLRARLQQSGCATAERIAGVLVARHGMSSDTIASNVQTLSQLLPQEGLEEVLKQDENTPIRLVDDSSRESMYVVSRLGGGGQGDVYCALAEDKELYVIKIINLNRTSNSAAKPDVKAMVGSRFAREVRLVKEIHDHDLGHITPEVIKLGTIGGNPYHMAKFEPGADLGKVFDRLAQHGHGVSTQLVLDVFVKTAFHLSELEKIGITHRDIKPSNIYISSSGEVKFLDFGIAKRPLHCDEGEMLTSDGLGVGTLDFMSPEQLEGNSENVCSKSDLYSLAKSLLAYLLRYPKIMHRGSYVINENLKDDIRLQLDRTLPPSRRKKDCIDHLIRCLSDVISDRPEYKDLINAVLPFTSFSGTLNDYSEFQIAVHQGQVLLRVRCPEKNMIPLGFTSYEDWIDHLNNKYAPPITLFKKHSRRRLAWLVSAFLGVAAIGLAVGYFGPILFRGNIEWERPIFKRPKSSAITQSMPTSKFAQPIMSSHMIESILFFPNSPLEFQLENAGKPGSENEHDFLVRSNSGNVTSVSFLIRSEQFSMLIDGNDDPLESKKDCLCTLQIDPNGTQIITLPSVGYFVVLPDDSVYVFSAYAQQICDSATGKIWQAQPRTLDQFFEHPALQDVFGE